jgi:hypothetical protein
MRMRLGAFAFILASLVLASLFASPALAGRRVALVIGNSEYEHISRLENPINDAKDVAETLGKLEFEIILVPNADRDRFEQALVEFGSKASGSDLALVYYAGHGVQHGDTNYLLPTDIAGDQGVVEIKAIDMGKVRRQLDKATGVKILILDACRNDPFTRDRGFERASIGSEGAAKGMLIAYAAAPGQVAMDGQGRRNSPFAEVLVDHLKKASGVEIRTLFNQVSDEVSVKTNGKQLPNINSMIHGNFYFLSPDEMCERSWKKAVDSQQRADFKAIVTNYPNCPRVSWAQHWIRLHDYLSVCDAEMKKLDAIAKDLNSLNNAAEHMECDAARAKAKELADAERARRAEAEAEQVCETDRKKVQDAVSAYDLGGLDALAKSTKCDAVRKLAETDIARLQRRCDEERDRLNAVPENDLDRLRADAANIVCKAIRTEAATRIAKLGRVCAADRKALDAVQSDDLDELKARAANIACKSIQQEAAERLTNLELTCEANRKEFRSRWNDRSALLAARDKMKCKQAREEADQRIAALPPSEEEKLPQQLACEKARDALGGTPKSVATLQAILMDLATAPSPCPDVIARINSALEEAECVAKVEAINKERKLSRLREAADDPNICKKARVAAQEKIDELESVVVGRKQEELRRRKQEEARRQKQEELRRQKQQEARSQKLEELRRKKQEEARRQKQEEERRTPDTSLNSRFPHGPGG